MVSLSVTRRPTHVRLQHVKSVRDEHHRARCPVRSVLSVGAAIDLDDRRTRSDRSAARREQEARDLASVEGWPSGQADLGKISRAESAHRRRFVFFFKQKTAYEI